MPISSVREIINPNNQPIQAILPFTVEEVKKSQPDLNFAGVETQHLTHAIHPYVAAINPPLARTLIERYVPEGATVFDPFCGGGGVLVEAIANKRLATGYDVNPLAVLLSSVKTTYIAQKDSLPVYLSILDKVRTFQHSDIATEPPDLIKYWYKEDSLFTLSALKIIISQIEDTKVRNLFLAVLSATSRDVMLTYRGEIRLRKLQGKDLEKFNPNVYTTFRKRAELAIERVSCLPKDAKTTVELKDARLTSSDLAVHSVVTSPPYGDDINGVGYFQFSRNMLYWIGYSLEEQKVNRKAFLGGIVEKENQTVELPSPTLANTVDVILNRNKTHYYQALSFYSDYYDVLTKLAQCVEKRIIIVIGDRILSRTQINNGHITTEFLDSLGFRLEQYYQRELRKKRIANLGGDGGGISIEHILVYNR